MQRARSDDAKDERRQSLLNAALEEFFERGYSAARMDDVARRAGLSKGTVYLYFDSKEGLFRALIESLTEPTIERLEFIATSAPTLSTAIQGLATFAPTLIQESKIPMLMKVIIGDSRVFPEIVHSYRTTVLERVLAVITELLRRGVERGEIETQNPALTARLVIAPIVLSGIWEALFHDDPEAQVDLPGLFAQHAEYLQRALQPTGPLT